MLTEILKRQRAVVLIYLILTLIGIYLVTQLPVQLYPQTQRPRVFVRINHAGISAVDFVRQYGDGVESGLLSIDGVDLLETEYQNDSSDFTLTFDWKVDSDQAKADVEASMNSISSQLPEDFRDDYFVRFFSGENAGFLLLGVRSASTSPKTLYALMKSSLENRLTRVPDAETVEIMNIEDREVEVNIRQAALLAYGLRISDVDSAFRRGYLPVPIGGIEDSGQDYSVRLAAEIGSIYQLGELLIADRGDASVRLADIADIVISYTLPRQALVIGGAPAIRINATPRDGGNIRQMSQEIVLILEQAREDEIIPADTEFQLYVDPAEYINRSIRNVVRAALIGAGLAMLIVLITLGEFRNTLLIGITLPVTMILSFILLYLFGVSLNLISLGGIALAVGMVIDPSIVVLENIHRHYDEAEEIHSRKALGKVIAASVGEVASPVIASTFTTVLVFLPISFTAPLTNAILGDQANAVIYALVFALVISLTLLPILALRLYRPVKLGPEASLTGLARLSRSGMGALSRAYRRSLKRIIAGKGRALLVVAGSFLMLAACLVFLLPRIPREIISPPSSDRIVVFFRSSEITDRVEIVEEVVPELEQRVREAAGEKVLESFALVSGRFNILFINMVSADAASEVLGDLQRVFVSDNTFYYNVSMWDPAQLPLPRTSDLQIGVHGEDEAQVVLLLEEIRDLVNESELYGRVYTDPPTGLSNQLVLNPRREVLDGFGGLTYATLNALTTRILRGTTSLEFEEGQETVTVSASFPEESLDSLEEMQNFLIYTQAGIVPLKHFYDFSTTTGVAGIASEDGEHIFRVYARMPSGSPAADRDRFEAQIEDLLAEKLEMPAGYSVAFENPQAELDDAIRSLFVALAVSVALIYLVLTLQFNSFRLPLVILVTVPLGFIGVVLSLLIFNSTLSLNSLLGTILLAGIVVNNAIIMIDFYLRMADEHESKLDAILKAATLRFPPILITMMTTILGMLPLAIGLGEGSNIVQPLGIAVSGGLLISTLFTLYVVPALLRFMPRPHHDEVL